MRDRSLTAVLIVLLTFLFSVDGSYAQSTEGIASYYASRFKGRKTSSGIVYHPDSLTAAHKSMAFGTRVKVTNLKNGKSVVVVINDRLPQRSKRSIDLSYAAARQLDFIRAGLTRVCIETLK